MMERIWYTCVFLALITAQYIVYCCNDNVRVLNDLALRSSETQSNFWSGGNDIVINDADLVSGWYSATLNGWQYLMTDVSNKPYYLRCSTYWPIYLKDNHTSIDDLTEEPVDVIACVRDDINPCSTRYTIQIRKCIGEIQYKLKPSEWYSAYCFEKHTLLQRSTPSPAPENVDFGRITVKPELEFKSILLGPVMTQNIPYLNFRCLFNKRNDLFYTVQWYIDETALDKTMGPSKDMADLVLNEDDLSSRNITMGIYVRCGVRASISENGMLTPMNRSEQFYAGIKISQTNVYLDKGSSAVVQMLSTVPIGCKYFKGTQTSLVCKAEMKLFVDDGDPLQCEKGSILNKVDEDDDNGNEVVNQHCAQYIKTLAKEDTWDPSDKFNFTIVTSDINYDDKRKFILKLQFGKTMSQTIWKDYFFPEVEVFVQNTDTYQKKVCKSRNDPHMTTADGYRYENHVTGTYMLYFNKEYNIEVQQTIKQCDYGWEIAKCTCAVGIKAGQDVFMINRCGSPTLFAFTQCGDGGILDVQRVNDLLYRVFTPIGTRVSIALFSWNIWMNVDIFMAPKDIGNVYGLCGRVDGNKSNDLTHRNTNVESPLGRNTYNYHLEFSESWRIDENADENLFRPGLRLLTPWVRQNGLYCVCNSTTRINEALCSPTQYLDCTKSGSITKTKCHIKNRRKREVGNHSSKEMQRILSKIAGQFSTRKRREDVPEIAITEEAKSICSKKISGIQAFNDFTDVGSNDDENTVIQQCEFDLSVVKDNSWADVHVEAVNDGVKNMLDLQPTVVENNSEKVENFYENTCPMNCSGQGKCVESGICSCFTYYKGPDCSIDERDGLTILDIEGGGECDLADGEECKCFYVRSENIQENFTCNVNTSKISKNGAVEFVSSSTSTGGFEDIFTGICCAPKSIIGSDDVFVAQYTVSISNNGIHFGNEESVYVFDSVCQSISTSESGSKSFSLKDDHCFVDGYCYSDNDMAPAGCRACQSSKALYDWTAFDPCQNGGNCSDETIGYSCICMPGYNGLNCENEIDECLSTPCKNGGVCSDLLNAYSCKCLDGFSGKDCQTDIDECSSNPCRNGASCINDINMYQCNCTDGYEGTYCEQNINECASDPCQNGGTCIDLIANFKCECMDGYEGITCSIELDECISNPCKNGGVCHDVVNGFQCACTLGYTGNNCEIDQCFSEPCKNGGTCVIRDNIYSCTCASGYEGHNCDKDVNECQSNPCKNGGTCKDLVNGFECSCAQGFNGVLCNDEINECLSKPCQNGGVCADLLNAYLCECPAGFSGENCENDIDECSSSPCRNGATCINGINMYQCTCSAGFEGEYCEENINECASDPCQNGGTCNDLVANFKCECVAGFEGNTCSKEINECNSNPCTNGGTCNDVVNGFQCVCADGYTGSNCEIDINECQSNPCKYGGTCKDLVNSFECACVQGYDGTTCNNEIDECLSTPCQNGGVCSDLLNDYSCKCPDGFSGKDCQTDIDECSSNPCRNGASCINDVNMYRCNCSDGYEGTHCEQNIDECASDPCANGGTCTDLVANFECECVNGFKGKTCSIEIKECLSNPCKNGGTCNDVVGGFRCTCADGYMGNNCEIDVNECQSSPCKNGGTCTDFINSFECVCVQGYGGALCNIEIDECLSAPCQNGGVCKDMLNAYLCKCPGGFSGKNCQTEVNECNSNPCKNGATCLDEVNGYNCTCADGHTGSNCEIDACSADPCKNRGTCVLDEKNYTCLCAVGYDGHDCENDINECSTIPCKNGATCKDDVNGFQCACADGYTGTNCEIDINECNSYPCKHGGSCKDSVNGYKCHCAPGYNGATCDNVVKSTSESPVTDIVRKQFLIVFEVRSAVNLTAPTFKEDIKHQLSQIYKSAMGDKFQKVDILDVRQGSIIVDFEVSYFNDLSSVNDLTEANLNLLRGEKIIRVFNETVKATSVSTGNVTVTNATLRDNKNMCAFFTVLNGKCEASLRCFITEGRPACVSDPNDEDDNDDLTLVIVAVVCSVVVLVIIVVATVCIAYHIIHKRKKLRKTKGKFSVRKEEKEKSKSPKHIGFYESSFMNGSFKSVSDFLEYNNTALPDEHTD